MKASKSCKITMFALLCIIFFITPKCFAEEYEYENFKYTIINENEVEITGLVNKNLIISNLIIPNEIKGMKVTTIKEIGGLEIHKITIPENVIQINAQNINGNLVVFGKKGTCAENYSNANDKVFIDIETIEWENNIGYVLDPETNEYKIVDCVENKNKILVIENIFNDLPVTKIEKAAFARCNFNEVIISSGIELEQASFLGNVSLKKLTIGDGIKILPSKAFSLCRNLEDITLPNSIETIEDNCFSSCYNIKELKLPVNLKEIGVLAFSTNASLETITLPETLTTIGNSAFSNCFELKEIIIPKSVNEIGNDVFYGSKNLITIHGYKDSYAETYASENNYTFTEIKDFFTYEIFGYDEIKITGLVDKNAEVENLEIPAELKNRRVTVIGNNAFYNNTNIKGIVTFPKTLIEIGDWSFSGCENIESVVFPENLKTIGANAFSSTGITGKLVLPEGLTKLGNAAFSGCEWISGELKIPNTIEVLEEMIFFDCSNIEKVTFPENLRVIGNGTFYFCTGLTGKLEIPKSVTEIGSNAFDYCTGLTGELILPDKLVKLGASAFRFCCNLTGTLKIPENIKTIEPYTFFSCSNLTSIKLPEGLEKIEEYAFDSCNSWEGELKLPNTLKKLGNNAFSWCENLTGELILPNSLIQIGDGVFMHCGFTKIVDSQTKVGDLKIEELFPTLTNHKIQKVVEHWGDELSSEDTLSSKDTIYISDSAGNTFATLTVIIKGDVNSDGKIRIYDAFQILKDVLVPGTNLSEIDKQIRDFNGDGQVRIYDAFQFLKQAILS